MSWVITGSEKTPVDLFRSQVSLLLHGDGINGSTTITDNSPTPKTVTAVGNAQISTAQSKFGGSSIAFDGVSDYLTVGSTAALTFGTGDFTVEAWVYVTAYTNAQNWIIGNYIGVFAGRFAFYILNSGATVGFRNGDINISTQSLTSAIPTATWVHLAVTRSSGSLRFFKDGNQEGSAVSFAADLNVVGSAGIGSAAPNFPNDDELNGYIDELRVTKGIARYTANFTPPTAPFPDI